MFETFRRNKVRFASYGSFSFSTPLPYSSRPAICVCKVFAIFWTGRFLEKSSSPGV